MGRHVELNGFHNHVTGGYFHHSSQISPGGNGYGIRFHGTDCIIDNNICDFLNKPLLGQTTGGGNVISYNYVPNAPIAPWNKGKYVDAAIKESPQIVDTWIETAIDPSHGGYSHSDLYEGNYAVNLHTDSTSNNGWIVLFRNHTFGKSVGGKGPDGAIYDSSHWTHGSLNGLAIDGPQNEHASIGNVYLPPENGAKARIWDKPGDSGGGTAVYRFGGNKSYNDIANGGHSDGGRQYALERFYWAHDYNYATNGLLSRESEGNWVVPSDNLPDSLYLSSPPEYFKGYAWPSVNPLHEKGKTPVSVLPAVDRYTVQNNRKII
jgi:hypothetical protein